MKSFRSILFHGLLTVALAGVAVAQTPDDFALIKKMKDATKNAPAARLNSTITDRDTGAVVETMTMERVAPDDVHVVTTHHGKLASEMISDGKRNLHRHGPNEPWKPTPINIGAMFHASLDYDEDDIREQHVHLKPVGEDHVGGIPAKVYELTSDDDNSKVWLAADNSRLLKAERDYDGSGPIETPQLNGDLKSLQAQLKAATTQHHLHSLTLYTYDPSIKITMPPD